MYEKYLIKDFDRQHYDCCHVASNFIKDNFKIDMTIVDNYSREYSPDQAYNCMMDAFSKNNFVEVAGSCKKGDLLIVKKNMCCYVCVDEKIALSVRKIVHISKISQRATHLRHRSLL